MIATAASAAPAASAPPKTSTRRATVPAPWGRATATRRTQKSVANISTWKLDSGWPPKNCSATSTASPANGSGPGRRARRSASRQIQGRNAQTLTVGQATQLTIQRLKPNTVPASSAPPKRIPSARPSRNVPNAARNSFKAATNASESQNGSTYRAR